MVINITIPSDLFYDPDDTISMTILPCTSNNVGVSEYINLDILKSKIITKLVSIFIGTCEVALVGYDSISQGVKTSFYINVIECNQPNCDVCEDISYNGCVKCNKGYSLDSITKNCIVNGVEIEVYLLLCFIIFCIPLKMFTNYRFNVIIMFFESLQIMYVLFAFIPSIGADFQIYFKSFRYLSFASRDFIYELKRFILRDITEISKEDYKELLLSFPDIVIVLTIFSVLMIMQIKWRLCFISNIRFGSFILTWIFLSFQFLSLSLFNNIIQFYKIHDILGIISIIASIIICVLITLYTYCCIVNRQIKCYLCSRLNIFERLKSYSIFEEIKSDNFCIFFISNQSRRLVILIFIFIGVKGYILFLYIACVLITQVYYQITIFSKEVFLRMKDRIFVNISELILFLIILICCSMFNLEYNTGINRDLSTSTSNSNDELTKILKFLIRSYIFLAIILELISLCAYFLLKITARCPRKKQAQIRYTHPERRVEHFPNHELQNLSSFSKIILPKESKVWNIKSKHNS